jgi:hypothetical protein
MSKQSMNKTTEILASLVRNIKIYYGPELIRIAVIECLSLYFVTKETQFHLNCNRACHKKSYALKYQN